MIGIFEPLYFLKIAPIPCLLRNDEGKSMYQKRVPSWVCSRFKKCIGQFASVCFTRLMMHFQSACATTPSLVLPKLCIPSTLNANIIPWQPQ